MGEWLLVTKFPSMALPVAAEVLRWQAVVEGKRVAAGSQLEASTIEWGLAEASEMEVVELMEPALVVVQNMEG